MHPIRAFQSEAIRPPRGFVPPGIPGGVPVDLEIGCGVGWHPIRYALANPDRFLVAIEHTQARFAAFARRLSSHPPIPNLLAVHADAVAWITHALAANSVDRLFFMYPNPNPKRGDLNKRWHAMPFMSRLLSVLKPGGEILLATNELFYVTEAREYFEEVWKQRVLEARSFTREDVPGGLPRTHFEKKYLLAGERCYQLRVQKSEVSIGA